MKVTKAVDYALKACLYLAACDASETFTSVRKLCEALSLRRAYLLKVLKVLEEHGIVQIQRGAHGGYRLARSAADISIKDLVEAIDGPLAISYLVETPEQCEDAIDQRMLTCWKQIQRALADEMAAVKLADLKPRTLVAKL